MVYYIKIGNNLMTQVTDPCVKNVRKIFVGGLSNNTGKRNTFY
jgi:hypothetical protein